MKKKWISDDIYGESLWLIWDCTEKEAADFLTKNYANQIEFPVYGIEEPLEARFWFSKAGAVAMYLSNKHSTENIDHELSHIVFCVFDNVGIPLNLDTREAYAYYFQYIKRKIMLCLQTPKKKKRGV